MDRDSFLFNATVSAKYHQRRHSFLVLVDTAINLIVVISAASSFGFLIGGEKRLLAQILTALITLLGLVQIVLRVGQSAHDHAEWYKKWRNLLKDIECTDNPSPEKLAQWNHQKTEIEVDCVSELRALEVDCRNHAITQLELDPKELRAIGFWQRVFIQLPNFQVNFPHIEEA